MQNPQISMRLSELFRLRSYAIDLMFCTINCERIESEIEN